MAKQFKVVAVNGVVAKRAQKATQRKGSGSGLKGQIATLFNGHQRTTQSKAVLLATFEGFKWQQITNAISNCNHRQATGAKTVINPVYNGTKCARNLVGYKYSHNA